MTRSVWVSHYYVQVRCVEGHVIVASVPNDNVCFFLGRSQNLFIINSRIDNETVGDMRLIIFSLLNSALISVKILHRSESLNNLSAQVTIRHGMPHNHNLITHLPQDSANSS